MPNPLYQVAIDLNNWQKEHAGHTKDHCLQAVRACLPKGLTLPQDIDDTALWCGETLSKNPAPFGWKLIGIHAEAIPVTQPALVFFNNCGHLPNGEIAGHIAVVKMSTKHLISNDTDDWSDWWAQKVAYVFEPANLA